MIWNAASTSSVAERGLSGSEGIENRERTYGGAHKMPVARAASQYGAGHTHRGTWFVRLNA